MEVSLKTGCLPYADGKQQSIPLINLGRKKMDVKLMMMMMIVYTDEQHLFVIPG